MSGSQVDYNNFSNLQAQCEAVSKKSLKDHIHNNQFSLRSNPNKFCNYVRKFYQTLSLVYVPRIQLFTKSTDQQMQYLIPQKKSCTYCTCAFLDISQAFDRVCHVVFLYILETFFPLSYYLILKMRYDLISHLTEKEFKIRYSTAMSGIASVNFLKCKIQARLLRGYHYKNNAPRGILHAIITQ